MNGQWELPKDGKVEDLTAPHSESVFRKTGRIFNPEETKEILRKSLMSLERDVTISPDTKGKRPNFFFRFSKYIK